MSDSADNGTRANGEHSPEADGPNRNKDELAAKVATIGVIVVGAALIEASLIPGMIVGAAAVLAPKYLPKLGVSAQPTFRALVRNAYKFGRKMRMTAAEAKEQVEDIVAEVHAEDAADPGASDTRKS